ncbi:MAG: Eco57I restriction-modification methylase domain-containing protein [Planctomycetes bacterium]|nr:Eco57I restriction-modification methylase domain-containing protein [Planctomycetota bacterium]
MTAPQEILKLIERFDNNRESYRSGTYNETQLRREIVDPFFEILGWDVNNEKGYAEAYKDVIHEDSIKIGGVTKAPDYCFRIGGTRKFFVETKKPSINLKDDISPAFQLRRYAWSAKLPLSILTDFEEFAVYDCRVKPDKSDKSSTARILYLTCAEYAQRWDEIVEIFSRDAVLKGSFDRYAETTKVKKGTASVDDAFLKEIESWRDTLARTLALRNPGLNQHDLNFTVQRTIDRIVFLRICEDRGMEPYGRLMALQNGDRVYARLCEMFHRADERYNSGLFHFQKDKDRAESPDTLTLSLAIDDSILKNIIKNLYYPDSPYEFSVISADILGQVYEQFLGKVIRLTAGHRAVVEEKPEVRKAGGVYYTPTYIVDYIVKNTVGRILDSGLQNDECAKIPISKGGKGVVKSEIQNPKSKIRNVTPKQVSKLKILDPACGSGSFLLGAYQYLLDWHRDWYVADGPEKWASGRSPALYQVADSNPLPSPFVKGGKPTESPLTKGETGGCQNISIQWGAIEPAKGGQRGIAGNWRLTTSERKRILLNNIYGVDIDPQAVEVTKLSLLLKVLEGESEQTLARQLKLFHERALPDLGNNIKCGNSLIGTDFYNNPLNPPLLRGNPDIPLNKGGEGVVTSGSLSDEERYRINPFDWETEFPEIMKNGGFDVVIGNPPYGAFFGDAEKDYIREKFKSYKYKFDSYIYFIEKAILLCKKRGFVSLITPELWLKLENCALLRKFVSESMSFEILKIYGESVFAKAVINTIVFLLRKSVQAENILIDTSEGIWQLSSKVWKENEGHVVDYRLRPEKSGLIAKIKKSANKDLSDFGDAIQGITPYDRYRGQNTELIKNRAYHYKNKHDNTCGKWLEGKDVSRYKLGWSGEWLSYGPWLAAPRDERFFKGLRLLFREVPGTGKRIQATIAEETYYHGHSITPFKLNNTKLVDLRYLLGMVNSKLISWYGGLILPNFGKDTFPKLNPQDIKALPIRSIDLSDLADKALHDRMVVLVNQMLELHKQLASAKTDHDKTVIQRQIDAADRQIDQLVYELYGLTDEEIKIVENGIL